MNVFCAKNKIASWIHPHATQTNVVILPKVIDTRRHFLQKARRLTLCREKRNRIFIEGNKSLTAQPVALIGNDAIGETPAPP